MLSEFKVSTAVGIYGYLTPTRVYLKKKGMGLSSNDK